MSFDQTSGKVFGFISTLGGQPNTTTLNHMRTVVRWIHGFSIPEQLVIAKVKTAFDDDGNLVDEDIKKRVDKFIDSIITNTEKLR